jgi:hypothetical protein
MRIKSPAGPTKTRRRWLQAVFSLIAAGPAGGFLYGVLHVGDPDPNPIGRFVHACLMAILTPLHAGFPPQREAGAVRSLNLWPHIAASFVLILGVLVVRDWRRARNH